MLLPPVCDSFHRHQLRTVLFHMFCVVIHRSAAWMYWPAEQLVPRSHLICFCKDLLIYLKGGKREEWKEGGTENERREGASFHLLAPFPHGCSGLWLCQEETKSLCFSWVFHMGAGAQALDPSSRAFSGLQQGTGSQAKQPGLEPVPVLECLCHRHKLSCVMVLALDYFCYLRGEESRRD